MKLKLITESEKLEFYTPDSQSKLELPYFASNVSAGFPSPAEDYVDSSLDLNTFLIKKPSATFYVRVKGDSMKDVNINDGDLLVVDRSLEAVNNCIAICILNGEFTVKRLIIGKDKILLQPENPDYPTIEIFPENDFEVWGVVAYVIHKV